MLCNTTILLLIKRFSAFKEYTVNFCHGILEDGVLFFITIPGLIMMRGGDSDFERDLGAVMFIWTIFRALEHAWKERNKARAREIYRMMKVKKENQSRSS